MMLEGSVVGAQKTVKGIALNEIVLTRQDVLQMLHFQVYLNDEFFNEYMQMASCGHADGSTATIYLRAARL